MVKTISKSELRKAIRRPHTIVYVAAAITGERMAYLQVYKRDLLKTINTEYADVGEFDVMIEEKQLIIVA